MTSLPDENVHFNLSENDFFMIEIGLMIIAGIFIVLLFKLISKIIKYILSKINKKPKS